MAKAQYFKAQFTFAAPLIEGFQQVVNGQVTGYYDVNGKPIADGFLSCVVSDETKAPDWAPDLIQPSPTIPDEVMARIDALPDDKTATLIEQITKLVDEAQTHV